MIISKFNNILKQIFVYALFIFCLLEFTAISNQAFQRFDVFALKHKLNYMTDRKTIEGHDIGLFIYASLPKNTSIEFSDKTMNPAKVAVKYEAYPIKVQKENGDAILDMDNIISQPPDGWIQYDILSKKLYAKKNLNIISPPKEIPTQSLLKTFFYAMLFLIFNIVTGFYFLKLININGQHIQDIWHISISYLTGFFLTSLTFWGYLVLKLPVEKSSLLILDLSILILLILMSISLKQNTTPSLQQTSEIQSKTWREHTIKIILIIMLLSIGWITISSPVRDWDGMSHWIMKSKIIFHEKSLNINYSHHSYYPMIWPVAIAQQFIIMGGTYDETAQWTSAILFIVFIIQLLKGLNLLGMSRHNRYQAVIIFLALFFTIRFLGIKSLSHFIRANAEDAFLAFFAAGIVGLLMWFKKPESKSYLWLGLIFSGGLLLVKFEGFIYSLSLAAALMLTLKKWQAIKEIRFYILGVMIFVLILGGWIIWIKMNGYYQPIPHLKEKFSFAKLISIADIFIELLKISKLPFAALVLIGFQYFYTPRRPMIKEEKFLLYLILPITAFCFVSAMAWPKHKIIEDFADVCFRMILHASPAVLFFSASRMLNEKR